MFNIGPQELLLILLVALVIVGPKRLPELSRTIGRGLREFRKAQDDVKRTIRLGLDDAEPVTPSPTRGAATAPAAAGTAAASGTETAETAAGAQATDAAADDAADIARTLGRGLAEIRRARQEIQRTFRVDLSDRPAPKPRPAPARPVVPEPASASAPAEPSPPVAPDPSAAAPEPEQSAGPAPG